MVGQGEFVVSGGQASPLLGVVERSFDDYQLWHVEKSIRMSKHDLAARHIYHRLRDSIDAHLMIVFAALAIARRIETATGRSLKKFDTTARCYRYITISADLIPTDLATAITAIHTKY